MTIAYGNGTDVERELTVRLGELVHAFVADLNAQGRLVEPGGADTLRRLKEHVHRQHSVPAAEPSDAEATGSAEHLPPAALALWEAITAPRAGEGTPGVPALPGLMNVLGVSETALTSADVPDSGDAPDGGRVPVDPDGARHPAALAPVTGVQEPPAAGGDQAQNAAAVTAARLRAENAGRLEVTQITSDHGCVTVHIHALSLGDWEYWLSAVGAPLDAPIQRSGWAQSVIGYLDGVEVRLTADAVPRLLEEAAHRATEPFCLGGRIYDLAVGHTDRLGQTWHYQGRRPEDDTPLLSLGGAGGPLYPLASVVTANGPLTPASPASPDDPETC